MCDPDYCIYTGDVNPKPELPKDLQLRSAGFHVHVGYDQFNVDRSIRLLYYLDAYLGLPSILIDKDTERRKLYGKAGCFRLTDYGCEYRTLSSYFMKDAEHIRWVFNQVLRAIYAYNNGFGLPNPDDVRSVIDNNDTRMAKLLCTKFGLCDNFLDN